MPVRVVESRQIAQILIMFMIVQFFGLFLATQYFSGLTYAQATSTQVITNVTSGFIYVGYIVVAAAVLLFLLKVYKGDKLFIILEAVLVFITSYFVFLVLTSILPFAEATLFVAWGTPITPGLLISIGAAIALIVAKNKYPRLRNTTAIIASVGVGFILGIAFGFFVAIIVMMVLALYDFIAVFITKHMVTMARAFSARNIAFLIGVNEVEAIPKSNFSSSEITTIEKEKNEINKIPILSKLYKENMLPAVARMELGNGDLAIPLMVSVAAYKVSLNFVLSFFVTFGAILGLFITSLILRKYKRPLPAIPPLLMGIAIGLITYILLFAVLKV